MPSAADSSPTPAGFSFPGQARIASVVALGLAVSVAAFLLVRQWDEERSRLYLSLQAQAAAGAVRASTEECREVLQNLAELMGRRTDLSRSEFAEVVEPLLARHPGLRALQWVPLVSAADRARVEDLASRETGRAFEFTQTNGAGGLRRADARTLHNPILYIEPLAGNEAALGFDLAIGPNRVEFGLARDLGGLVLSRPIRMVQEPGEQLGYVAIMPVFRGGGLPRTLAERQARLAGFVQGVFRMGDFLREAMREAPPVRLELLVLDASPATPVREVHFLAAAGGTLLSTPTEAELRSGWHSEQRMRLGGRVFALLFRPGPGAVAALRSGNAYGALVSGLFLTITGACYLRAELRRAAQAQAADAARTAERERARQLELLHTLVDAIPDAIYIKDKAGRLLLHNAAHRSLLGPRQGGQVASATEEGSRPNNSGETHDTAEDRAGLERGEAISNREQGFTQADGSPGWLLVTKVPVRDGQGGITGIVSVSHDITARRRRQQALAESEARFRVLFESSPDAIFVESREGIVLDANPSACRLQAMSHQELLGRHVTELVPPNRRATVRESFASLFSDEPVLQESESLTRDGRVIPIELAARRFEYGGAVATLIHVRDISERRRTQAALEGRDRILHAVARAARTLLHAQAWQAAAPEVLAELGAATGTNMVCLYANELVAGVPGFRSACQWPLVTGPSSGEAAVGYQAAGCNRWRELLARGEVVHGRVSDLPTSERALPERKGVKSIALTPIFAGELWWGFLALGQSDRERTWLTLELEALRTAAEVFGAAIERATAEAERVRIQTRLQEAQRLESLGVLAGGIAHDFNNLLASILGNASLARLELTPVSPVAYPLQQIEQASLRAADLCKQMLAYAGKGRFVVRAVDLSELVQDTARLLQVSISRKAVLKIDCTLGLPATLADPSQIRQIVMNLVINASEAIGDRSGVIALNTGLVRVDRSYLAGTHLAPDFPEGDYVFLDVSDTGSGMAPEVRDRIFEPFFTTKFTGRGLGLAAVLGIVLGHKGGLQVTSEPGRGSTFRLLLPTAPGAIADAPVAGTLANTWRGRGRVLVVDDEEGVRAVVARMLENLGFTVTLAVDGSDAVTVFSAQPDAFTFVMMDFTMPHFDGGEAFVRMQRLRPAVRVVMMSGFSEQEATITFASQGLAGFLQKPFDLAQLRAKVREIYDYAASS